MKEYTGHSVFKGIARGPIAVLKSAAPVVVRMAIEDPEEEITRVEMAIAQARQQLQVLYDKTLAEVGKDQAAIFEVHRMMLEDEDYVSGICDRIRTELVCGAYAVDETGMEFADLFASMDDDYMRARAADVVDISNRLVRILQGTTEPDFASMPPSVILADDLTPSQTVQIDREKILAFATVHGSANSHTAILARTMNIPALVGVPIQPDTLENGTQAIVDGFLGRLILEPTQEACEEADEQIAREQEKRMLLQQLKGMENVTKDGTGVLVYANIGSVSDVDDALANDAGGIGLFRSEFLYLGRKDFPTEEEQYQAYRQVLQAMGDKKVIIRTLDIGADKQADYFHLDKEENPAMGYRAIRICLTQTKVFRTQLRALLRAAVYGNLSIMYPMIISVKEVEQIRALVEETAAELDAEQIAYRIPEQGIMIETPAAVMISDRLAKLVDFFSIGTNDLTQYTLAIDRQNEKLGDFYDAHHEAILRMIQITIDSAHKCGKWVGICGELGADLMLTEQLLRMGVDELSVAPSMILRLRERIREIDLNT